MRDGRLTAWGELDDVEALRQRAHDARMTAIRDLDRDARAVHRVGRGARRPRARLRDGRGGVRTSILDICRTHEARLVAKSKSMATEEIGLNAALEAGGLEVVETDLGEYILQLLGEHPVHIVGPAIEKTKEEVAELFSRLEGEPVAGRRRPSLTAVARRRLREVFLTADVGVTGRELPRRRDRHDRHRHERGQRPARRVAAPRAHRGHRDRAARPHPRRPRPAAHPARPERHRAAALELHAPRHRARGGEGETDGPEELHVVLLEDGRRNLLGTRYEEMLACIRCGACLNVCPVYRHTAGAAYGPVYSGPMGAVLAPLLVGVGQRAVASARLVALRRLHRRLPGEDPTPRPAARAPPRPRRGAAHASRLERLAITAWSLAWSTPLGYRLTTRLARLGQRLAGAGGPGAVWARGRDAPPARAPPLPGRRPVSDLVERFRRELRAQRARRPRRRGPGDRGRRRLERARTGSPTRAASSSPRRPTSRAPARSCPTIHIAVLDEDRILPDLAALLRAVRGALPSSLAIISGPSRTADIEMTLAIGVHGPREQHVVVRRVGALLAQTARG